MDSKLNIDIFQICRTCTKKITSCFSFSYLDYSEHTHLTIRQKLNNCIPELDLSIVSDAVICSKCADAITCFYEFKQKCLELEIQIKKYIQQVQHTGDVNLVEMVRFQQLHNTKFKIEDFEAPIEDIKSVDLVCDIDAFNELHECTESNERAYLHKPHTQNIDMKVKMEDVQSTEDFKIKHFVCHTNAINEATDSIQPSTSSLTLEKVYRQYALFNTVENCIDGSLLATEKHSDINNSNIARDSFNQNLSKRHVYYQCYRCGHKVASKLKLSLHLKCHKDLISKKPQKNYKNVSCYYRCSLCKYSTKYKCLFSVHSRMHLTKNNYYARIFQNKDNLTKPFVATIKVNKLTIKGDKRKYIKHLYIQHNFKNRNKHIEPTQHFGHQNSLKLDIKDNIIEKLFNCSICECQFNKKGNLKRHLLTHTGEKPFSCSVCKYQCSLKHTLKRHLQTHTEEKPFACSICAYQCNLRANLTRHMRLHAGEKPFSCSVCDYQCSQKSTLKQHILIHTGEKPFACTFCKYQCNRKEHLKEHIRIHTGEKPFSCSVCEYRCNFKRKLKQHIQIHTRGKPFSCSICEYQCSRKSDLKRHILIHTGEKPSAAFVNTSVAKKNV